jgi:hypothetical protein
MSFTGAAARGTEQRDKLIPERWPGRAGAGVPRLATPPISRAAIPASRIFGAAAHQIGPFPSQTLVVVQVKAGPAAAAEIRNANMGPA